MKTVAIDPEELRRALAYDPLTGKLTWRSRDDLPGNFNRSLVGREAGTRESGRHRGRGKLMVAGQRIKTARAIWAIAYGVDPGDLMVDHIDGNPANDRLDNLRLATASQNTANCRPARRSLPKGVCRRRGGFSAEVRFGNNRRYLGTFPTAEDAARAYQDAAREIFGSFACFADR